MLRLLKAKPTRTRKHIRQSHSKEWMKGTHQYLETNKHQSIYVRGKKWSNHTRMDEDLAYPAIFTVKQVINNKVKRYTPS